MIASPVDWFTHLFLDWNIIIYSVQLESDGLLQLLTEYGRGVLRALQRCCQSMAEVFSEYAEVFSERLKMITSFSG